MTGITARRTYVPKWKGIAARVFRAGTILRVEPAAIASLLEPYVSGLSVTQLDRLSAYLDLLLRWNRRMNLTSVRRAEDIVTRHFGESLFAASQLLPAVSVIDLGSGAGFPGLPMKIYRPELRLTLIESQNKKGTFLKEAVRGLGLEHVEVFSGRAEAFPGRADLVTLRAVERFAASLPLAGRLVAAGGRIGLLIGQAQSDEAKAILPSFSWAQAVVVPGSTRRVLLCGSKPVEQ